MAQGGPWIYCRLGSVKKAADAAGRKLCFIGMSLNTYLEAAALQGQAPFNPRDLIQPAELNDYDPSQVMIVTTGSQVGLGYQNCQQDVLSSSATIISSLSDR